jgi:hypothetical protein
MKIEAASANRLLFSDSRFCPPKDSFSFHEPSCDGKLVIYGAQVLHLPSLRPFALLLRSLLSYLRVPIALPNT